MIAIKPSPDIKMLNDIADALEKEQAGDQGS